MTLIGRREGESRTTAIAKCSFSGTTIMPGTGIMFVTKAGKVYNFCSRKCEKNFLKLGRIPRHVRWTEEYRKAREKRGAKK